ncbi:MAG: SCO6745 family protein [Acidimicrobiales bacterium]
MDLDDVIAAFSDPSASVPAVIADASRPRRLRDAIEPIAMHSVWSRTTNDRLAGFGLDFMGSYLLSRASLLGAPEPGVVAAAFAVFEPAMVEAAYQQARHLVGGDELLAAREEATTVSLTAVLGDGELPAIVEVTDRLQAAVSEADGTGRPLFSGLAGRRWPDDPVARLWRACEQAREHRGDSHVAVCTARGLGPVEMNVLTELWLDMPLGSYTATRGWPGEAIDAAVGSLEAREMVSDGRPTDAGRAFRDAIEADTDALEQPVVDGLGPDPDAVIEQLAAWSDRCVAAGAFPDNPHKRAAG